ncbi:unnamed protein product [Arctia plantaginis]|uniref:Uncharacterized protein n=1 Tax=Arctia plantaginis TaxID=874455 RepID=A0A8S1AE36_ARCPL|nr:unnamed protein product [Arctia plantaginis]
MTREVKLKAREVRCDKSARGQRAQPVPSSPVNRAQAPFRADATSVRDTLERIHTTPRPALVPLPGALTSEKGPPRSARSIAQILRALALLSRLPRISIVKSTKWR